LRIEAKKASQSGLVYSELGNWSDIVNFPVGFFAWSNPSCAPQVKIKGVDRVRDSLKILLYRFTTLPPEGLALGAEYENTLVSILVPSMIAFVVIVLV